MAISPLDSQLFAPLFADEMITAVFSDDHFIKTMAHVEAALAKVQGELGVIPKDAAQLIWEKAASLEIDMAPMQASVDKAGVPVIELVRQLKDHVGDEAADFVHWGATTQDIMDTARVLQLREAVTLLSATLHDVIKNLAKMADAHRHTIMAGRTHSQQALPISFGLKVANWLAPLLRDRARLAELKPRLFVVQLGGAVGTLAPLGKMGTAVQTALANQLELAVPATPWHTQRDNFAEFAGWLSLVSSSLAKMAQDIILMTQSEVGEVRETADAARGGSSTMPQKSNPMISELIVAAARTNATLLSNMHQAMIQEHERATHGWQMEWLTLPQMVGLTAVSLNKAQFLSENLVINKDKMQETIVQSNGLMLAEAASFALAPAHMSRSAAKQLVKAACQQAIQENRHLFDVLQDKTNAPIDWARLKNEANYLGSADEFINRLLRDV